MKPDTGWFTATACTSGTCVECNFVTAECTDRGKCVEVAHNNALHDGYVLIRDSKENDTPDRVILKFTPAEWTDYIADLKLGVGAIKSHTDEGIRFVVIRDGEWLRFTEDEWTVFMDGVHKGEFDIAPI